MPEEPGRVVGIGIGIEPVDPGSARAQACLERYFAELGERFEGGFSQDIGCAVSLEEMRPPRGLFLVASARETTAGCGALVIRVPGVAELKRMWVSPAFRGEGLGRRLLEELESRAVSLGCQRARLDTNKSLTEAIALYRSAGYLETVPFNHDTYVDYWFDKPLQGERRRSAPR